MFKVKELLSPVSQYLLNASWLRKTFDALLLIAILFAWAVAVGKITIKPMGYTPSSVERNVELMDEVGYILNETITQNQNYTFAARMLFHNTLRSLNGSFSFIKYSITEWSAKRHLNLDPKQWTDIPWSADIDMIRVLINGECHATSVIHNSPLFTNYVRMDTRSVVYCPLFDNAGKLSGFIVLGNRKNDQIDTELARDMANRIQQL